MFFIQVKRYFFKKLNSDWHPGSLTFQMPLKLTLMLQPSSAYVFQVFKSLTQFEYLLLTLKKLINKIFSLNLGSYYTNLEDLELE